VTAEDRSSNVEFEDCAQCWYPDSGRKPGKCANCEGGTDGLGCSVCGGTGVCQECEGTGRTPVKIDTSEVHGDLTPPGA
jgi:hypothetical protein